MSRNTIDLKRRSGLISCLTRCLQLSHLAVTGVSPTKSALKVYSMRIAASKVDSGYERIAAFMNEDLKWMDQTTELWQGKTIVLL